MRVRTATALLGILVLAGCDATDEVASPDPAVQDAQQSHVADAAPIRTYEITVENLTSEGQPFTPPLVTLHRRAEDLFTVGKAASTELQEIAENGNLGPMQELLGLSRHVSSVGVGLTPPVPPANCPPP